jgi:hypothetical protein
MAHPLVPSASVPPPALSPSLPPRIASSPGGSRTAWKKSSTTIGRGSGLLLLAVAGLAILGVLFVVFSLME